MNNKILVVDDTYIFRKLLCEMCAKKGFEIDEAKDGLEAIKMATCKKYDAIFMDIQMPNLDGISATKILREEGTTSLIS